MFAAFTRGAAAAKPVKIIRRQALDHLGDGLSALVRVNPRRATKPETPSRRPRHPTPNLREIGSASVSNSPNRRGQTATSIRENSAPTAYQRPFHQEGG